MQRRGSGSALTSEILTTIEVRAPVLFNEVINISAVITFVKNLALFVFLTIVNTVLILIAFGREHEKRNAFTDYSEF